MGIITNTINKQFSEKLEIVQNNTDTLSQEGFALIRRKGIGASEIAAILGLYKNFKTSNDIFKMKITDKYTAEEAAVGELEVVRKGIDLEPVILNKFSTAMKYVVWKPNKMFKIKEYPYLLINYDGLAVDGINNKLFPIEAKFVSTYGSKYWNKERSMLKGFEATEEQAKALTTSSLITHAEDAEGLYGVPMYYYCQVQQQMLGCDADHGYIAALFDKGWEFNCFKIYPNEWFQKQIILEGYKFWNQVEDYKAKIS